VAYKRQHLITTTWRIAKELNVTYCPFDSLNLYSTFDSNSTQLDYSPIISTYKEGLIATCDGLLCFVIDNRLAVLYNPSIRKVKKLPYIDHLPRVQGLTHYAFGYDPFIDNYKVVAVFCYGRFDHYYKNQVKVHSVGTDSWRRIKDFPSMFRLDSYGTSHHGVFVSGTVNWLAGHILNEFYARAIVSLHLGDESYREIPLPDLENSSWFTLDVVRDCLCIFFQKSSDSCIDIWLMKEYGNKESWTILISLPSFGNSRFFLHTNIVYISEDDNHVLLGSSEIQYGKSKHKFKWVIYDLENNTIKSSKIHDSLGLVKSKIYVESLISL
jgi:F-box interacting protein